MSQDIEELDVKFSDTINQPVIRQRIEDIVQEDLAYRQAFREYPAGNLGSNSAEIPVPADDMGHASKVGEAAEFPREQDHYETKTLTFDKYGFEVSITYEAQEDSMLNIVQDQVDRQGRQLRETLNAEAFEHLNSNTGATVGDGDDVMSYDDVLQSRKTLMKKNYDPDLLICDVEAVTDLMSSNNFLEASEMQGEMRRSGQVGEIAGLDVVQVADDHQINGGEHNGFLVDTDFYGYEGVRDGIQTEEYEETRTQSDVFRVFTRMGWLTMEPDAAVTIDG